MLRNLIFTSLKWLFSFLVFLRHDFVYNNQLFTNSSLEYSKTMLFLLINTIVMLLVTIHLRIFTNKESLFWPFFLSYLWSCFPLSHRKPKLGYGNPKFAYSECVFHVHWTKNMTLASHIDNTTLHKSLCFIPVL